MTKSPPVEGIPGDYPSGPAALLGGPFDGTEWPSITRSEWLKVRLQGSENPEWYLRTALRMDGTLVYSHTSVDDGEVVWPMVCRHPFFDGDDDDGPEWDGVLA